MRAGKALPADAATRANDASTTAVPAVITNRTCYAGGKKNRRIRMVIDAT